MLALHHVVEEKIVQLLDVVDADEGLAVDQKLDAALQLCVLAER